MPLPLSLSRHAEGIATDIRRRYPQRLASGDRDARTRARRFDREQLAPRDRSRLGRLPDPRPHLWVSFLSLHTEEKSQLESIERNDTRLIPVLAAKSGVVSFVLSLPSLPRETLFCLVDGFSRIMGMTTLGVDPVVAHPNQAVRDSPWAMVLIAFVSGGGGGVLVPLLNLFGPEWGFTKTPSFVKDGVPIDVWSAALIGYVYA